MSFEFKNNKEGEKIGRLFAEGVGVGLSESSYMAITAMENVYVELETLTKNAAKNAEKLAKKQQERQLSNLKNARELELITEKEYYEKLKEYRDNFLREGSDNWYKCTEEIAEYNKRMYEKIIELRDDLAKKLKSDDPWLLTSKVRFKGMGENGTDLVYNTEEFKDFEEEIRLLENYRDRVLELQKLEGVPDGVFSDISKMDIESGLKAVNAILLSDEETRKKFLSGYGSYEAKTKETATDLFGVLNGEKLKDEGIYVFEGFSQGVLKETDKEEFVKILEKSFSHVPESYFSLGEQSGEAFGDGFMAKLPQIMEDAKAYFAAVINELAEKVSSAMLYGAELAATNISNSYTSTYTFNSSKDTTTQQLNAARNAATVERLRGGNESGT